MDMIHASTMSSQKTLLVLRFRQDRDWLLHPLEFCLLYASGENNLNFIVKTNQARHTEIQQAFKVSTKIQLDQCCGISYERDASVFVPSTHHIEECLQLLLA
jgi:hypothetical protein